MFILLKSVNICRGITLGRMPYYAVARGRNVGVFGTWAECEAQVKGHSGARYKKFDTEQLAKDFIAAEGKPLGPPKANARSVSAVAKPSRPLTTVEAKPTMPTTRVRPPLKRKASTEIEKTLSKHMDRIEAKVIAVGTGIDRIAHYARRQAILIDQPTDQPISSGEWQRDAEGFVKVWTDGSCLSNGRHGARAGCGVWWGVGHPENVSAPASRATNNSGEVQAATMALQIATKHRLKRVALHTDSQFLVSAATRWLPGWRSAGWVRAGGKPLLNADDFRELDEAWGSSGLEVKWVHVRGHSGHVGNEAADALARAGALMEPHNAKRVFLDSESDSS